MPIREGGIRYGCGIWFFGMDLMLRTVSDPRGVILFAFVLELLDAYSFKSCSKFFFFLAFTFLAHLRNNISCASQSFNHLVNE